MSVHGIWENPLQFWDSRLSDRIWMRIFLLQNSNHNVHEGSSVIVVKNRLWNHSDGLKLTSVIYEWPGEKFWTILSLNFVICKMGDNNST